VSDDTVPQFGRSLREDGSRAPIAGASRPTSCPTCGSHFSPDGRFCPFDGSGLVPAEGWDPSADALLGSLVDGRYEVLAVLGEGGMGTVYEVKHRALGKRFALKALRKDLTADGEIAARFIQEARTAAAVSHPGLVEITDFGRLESGQVYFVMELLEGQSLAALLRTGGPLPAARGLDIVRQLVHALKAAHDASIVHRDLKPDNIHVGRGDAERDLVKIVDFGLAKVIGSSKLTRAGMVFGTPHYMSPEQAAGEVVDHRADIYALGIVMYEMFTGKVPFEADSYMGVLTKHMYMAPAPPSEVSPELKELGTLEDVILRCLQKRPSARYDNLAALLVDLDQRVPKPGRQARAVDPLALADQLELPRASEGRKQRAFAHWPLVIVAGAFACGIVLVLLLRRTRGAGPGEAAPPTVAISAPSLAKAGGTPSSAALIDAPAGPASASRSAQPVVSAPVPARKPARPTSIPSKKVAGAASKRPAGSGDIVDPWAR
jgi:tRNA A-37 threonylcarbamoyl transferase component Bud32